MYRKKASKKFVEDFNDAFKYYFDEEYSNYKAEGFPLIHAFVKDESSVTYQRLSVFLSLYGIFRTLTLTFIIITIITTSVGLFLYMTVSILLVLICFFAYLKHFRYYTEELFRSFIVISIKEKKKREKGKT